MWSGCRSLAGNSALIFDPNTSTTVTINNAQSQLLRKIIDQILIPIHPGKFDPSFNLKRLQVIYKLYTDPDTFIDLNIERIDEADRQLRDAISFLHHLIVQAQAWDTERSRGIPPPPIAD